MKSWYWGLGLVGVVVVVVLASTWTPSRGATAAFGWFLIALSFIALALRVFKHPPASATLQRDPLWRVIFNSVGMTLVGVQFIWPQYRVANAGVALVLVAMIPEWIRLVRES